MLNRLEKYFNNHKIMAIKVWSLAYYNVTCILWEHLEVVFKGYATPNQKDGMIAWILVWVLTAITYLVYYNKLSKNRKTK